MRPPGLSLRHTIRLECSVCRLSMSEDPDRDILAEAALFGWVELAICPSCGKKPEDHTAEDYIDRAVAFLNRVKELHAAGSEPEVAHLGAHYELEEKVSEDEHPTIDDNRGDLPPRRVVKKAQRKSGLQKALADREAKSGGKALQKRKVNGR